LCINRFSSTQQSRTGSSMCGLERFGLRQSAIKTQDTLSKTCQYYLNFLGNVFDEDNRFIDLGKSLQWPPVSKQTAITLKAMTLKVTRKSHGSAPLHVGAPVIVIISEPKLVKPIRCTSKQSFTLAIFSNIFKPTRRLR